MNFLYLQKSNINTSRGKEASSHHSIPSMIGLEKGSFFRSSVTAVQSSNRHMFSYIQKKKRQDDKRVIELPQLNHFCLTLAGENWETSKDVKEKSLIHRSIRWIAWETLQPQASHAYSPTFSAHLSPYQCPAICRGKECRTGIRNINPAARGTLWKLQLQISITLKLYGLCPARYIPNREVRQPKRRKD